METCTYSQEKGPVLLENEFHFGDWSLIKAYYTTRYSFRHNHINSIRNPYIIEYSDRVNCHCGEFVPESLRMFRNLLEAEL